MLSSKTIHTLKCDYCPRKTTGTGTPGALRAKAAESGWQRRPATGPDRELLDVCPQCAVKYPPEVRRMAVRRGRPRLPRPFRTNVGIHPPAGPDTSGPPAGPATL